MNISAMTSEYRIVSIEHVFDSGNMSLYIGLILDWTLFRLFTNTYGHVCLHVETLIHYAY